MSSPPGNVWSVGAVAQQLGIAPATLRTWDRRYGIGPSSHDVGAHRRYSDGDVAKLRAMADLLKQGMSARDAASVAATVTPSSRHRRSARAGAASPASTSAWTRGTTRAAASLDAGAVVQRVREAIAAYGIVATWERLLVPVLAEAGMRFETTGTGIDVEHLLTDGIMTAIAAELQSWPAPRSGVRPALLASAPEELHQLPMHALRAGLAERGHPARFIGPATPQAALLAAAERVGPSAIVIWSQLPATADVELLESIPRNRRLTRLFAAGPGWDAVRLPAGVDHPASLGEAVERVAAAARA